MTLGYRSRTRRKFKKPFRRNGAIRMTNYMTQFRKGDIVDIVVDSAIHRGMPHQFYHGRTGKVFNLNNRSVGVKMLKVVGQRKLWKYLNIRVEHLRHSGSRSAFLDRVRINDKLKCEANKAGKPISTKREVEGVKPERTVKFDVENITYRVREPFIDIH